jgi:hypothetical protein
MVVSVPCGSLANASSTLSFTFCCLVAAAAGHRKTDGVDEILNRARALCVPGTGSQTLQEPMLLNSV